MFTFLQINSSSDYTPTFSDAVILFCPRFGGLTSGGHVNGLRSLNVSLYLREFGFFKIVWILPKFKTYNSI